MTSHVQNISSITIYRAGDVMPDDTPSQRKHLSPYVDTTRLNIILIAIRRQRIRHAATTPLTRDDALRPDQAITPMTRRQY